MKKILLMTAMLFCLPAQAEWSKQYELAYAMGDGDTKGSARQAAIEQIKLKASSEAGTYVDSTTTLKADGSLTESIQMVSATMVKVSIGKESISVSPSGQAILNLVAVATLDDAELAKRVEVLRQDKEKARQMKVLQAENEALRVGLKKIRESLAAKADPATVAELLAKQDQTIRKLEKNGQTVTQVFSQGTLLQLASKNSDALNEAQRYFDEELYAYLLGTKVSANIEAVEQSGEGYVALVRVGWNLDLGKVKGILAKHLRVSKYAIQRSDAYMQISEYENENGKGVSNLSHHLYQYLAERAVLARISIGEASLALPVFYGGGGWNACSEPMLPSRWSWQLPKSICVTKQLESGENILGSNHPNPIRIRLTKAQAEAATSVSAHMFLMDKPTEDRKRAEEEVRLRIKREYGPW